MTSGMAADIAALLTSTSARTLTVGIDKTGRILQHDRTAGEVLGRVRPARCSASSSAAMITGSSYGGGLQQLIDAACSDREGAAVLTIKTGNGHPADAVVTVQPLRSADPRLVAQVVLRIAPPVGGAVPGPGGHAARPARRRVLQDRRRTRHRPDGARPGQHHRPALLQRGRPARAGEPGGRGRAAQRVARRTAPAPAARDRARRQRPGVGRGVPDRRDPQLSAERPVHRVPGDRPAGPAGPREQQPGRGDRPGHAPPPGGQVAVRHVHAAAAADRPRNHARVPGLHAGTRATADSTPTTPRSAWSSPRARRSSSTTPAGTAGSAPPR